MDFETGIGKTMQAQCFSKLSVVLYDRENSEQCVGVTGLSDGATVSLPYPMSK